MADEVLTIALDADIRGAIQQVARFQKEVEKQFKRTTKSVESVGKANKAATKEAVEDTRKWVNSLGALGKYHKKEIDLIGNIEKTIAALDKARGSGDKNQQAAIEKRIKSLQKEVSERKKSVKALSSAGFDVKAMGTEAKAAMKEAGEGLKSTLSSFFSKDLPGMVSGSGKMLTRGLGGVLRGLAAGGAHMKAKGTAMQQQRAETGKGPGMAGGAMKAVGGMFAKLGSLVKVFEKIVPLIGFISSAFMALVKILIDAEIQAKKFNANILQSASTVEVLAAESWDADAGFNTLEKTLNELREAAYSLDSLKWGISAEEHMAVLNVLTQEGVTLQRIREEAQRAGKELEVFAGELTHVSVAYSRAFGMPLQEITQLQGELMTDMGMSLEETRLAFGQMTRAAVDSGIASNKFFTIIKGVSQDLSLYNLRLGDSVKLLAALGKVMNPREAQKFFSTVMRGMKEMGLQERIKVGLMTNPGDILAKEQEKRYKDLGKMLNMESKEVAKVLKTQGTKGLEGAISKLDKSKQGAAREFALQTDIAGQAGGRGPVGTGVAMGMAGPGASAEIMARAVMTFGKGFKSLKDAIGAMGPTMTASMLGVSDEQLRSYASLEYAVNLQRDTLKNQLAAGGAERAKALYALEQANLAEADVAKAGWDSILATMGENADAVKKAAEDQMTPMEKMAKKQGDLTQDILSQLGVILDWLMNQLYGIMTNIWDTIMKFTWGPTEEEESMRSIELTARSLKTEGPEKAMRDELMAVLKKTAGMKAADRLKEVEPVMGKIIKTKESRGTLPTGAELVKAFQMTGPEKDKLALQNLQAADIGQLSKAWSLSKKQEEELAMLQLRLLGEIQKGTKQEDLIKQFGGPLKEVLLMIQRKVEKKKEAGQGPTAAPLKLLSKKEVYEQDLKLLGQAQADKNKIDREAYVNQLEKSDQMIKVGGDSVAVLGQIDTLFSKPNTAYVKFPSDWLKGSYSKAVEAAVLDAMRVAMFEYFMYSELDRSKIADLLKTEDMSIGAFTQMIGKKTKEEGRSPVDFIETAAEKPNQFGALVTGIKGGRAILKPPPPGEAYVPAMPGEEITPSYRRGRGGGGGSTHVIISLNPGAQQMFRAEVQDGIYEHERRKRLG